MRHLTAIIIIASLFWIFPQRGKAQILEVKQTVYGMDCAPCAYALENRMNNMEGITSASVSLNEGLLTAALANENTLTLNQIRKAVVESGFSPRKAEIKVTGTLQKEDGKHVIITLSGDKYALKPNTSDAEKRLGNIQVGQKVTLSGRIQQEMAETGYWTLAIEDV